jgi:hypothetical protein
MNRSLLGGLALALGLFGCSSSDPITTEKDPAPEFTPRPTPTSARLAWNVGDLATNPPVFLEGVEVCVHEHPDIPCAETDDAGRVELAGLPRDTPLDLTFHKDGYIPTLKTIETSFVDMDGTANPVMMPAVGTLGTPGVELELETKGVLGFFAVGDSGPVPGTKVSLSPASGDGPFFVGLDGVIDPDATATLAVGGVFFNLEPGEYTLTTSAEGRKCAGMSFPFAAFGIPAGGESVIGHVLPGYYTWQVGTLCTPL